MDLCRIVGSFAHLGRAELRPARSFVCVQITHCTLSFKPNLTISSEVLWSCIFNGNPVNSVSSGRDHEETRPASVSLPEYHRRRLFAEYILSKIW